MRIGVQLAQAGRLADVNALRRSATAAEQVGFDSVWVRDGLLRPGDDSRLLDPLGVLAFVAAITDRVRVGASVLVAPWYRPMPLARMLTTIDQLSKGRLVVGLGLDSSPPEDDAAGVATGERGERLDEALDVLDVHWADGPAECDGATVRFRRSDVPPKPVPRPRPPVLIDGHTPSELDRIARRADGWNPAGVPVELLAPMWAQVRELAASYGRDPATLSLVVRANITLTDVSIGGERPAYHGNLQQVAVDLAATADAGADEVILSLHADPKLDEMLDVYAQLAESLDHRPMINR